MTDIGATPPTTSAADFTPPTSSNADTATAGADSSQVTSSWFDTAQSYLNDAANTAHEFAKTHLDSSGAKFAVHTLAAVASFGFAASLLQSDSTVNKIAGAAFGALGALATVSAACNGYQFSAEYWQQ